MCVGRESRHFALPHFIIVAPFVFFDDTKVRQGARHEKNKKTVLLNKSFRVPTL